jgi:hypothetical protein
MRKKKEEEEGIRSLVGWIQRKETLPHFVWFPKKRSIVVVGVQKKKKRRGWALVCLLA